MRILVLQPYIDGAGHYGKQTARICQQMAALGHCVVLCTNMDNTATYLNEVRRFDVVTLDPPRPFFNAERKRTNFFPAWFWGRIWNNVLVLRQATRLALTAPFDVTQLLSYELVSTSLFLSLARPVGMGRLVIEIAAPLYTPRRTYFGALEPAWRLLQNLALRRMLGRWIHAIAVNSVSHVPELRRQLGLDAQFPIEVVGDSREPGVHLDKADARKQIGLSGYNGTIFLFFGTLRPDKGIDTLLRAVRQLPDEDFMLVLAGMPAGWKPDKMQDLLADRRVIMRFEYIPEEEMNVYFHASDALVLPYSGFYVASGGPLYEAAARGLPVIASDVSEMGHIVRASNLGLVVPPDDPLALTRAIQTFLVSSGRQRELWVANGLALVRDQSRSVVAQRLIRVCERVLADASANER